MGRFFDRVAALFSDDDWQGQVVDETILRFDRVDDEDDWTCLAVIEEDTEQLVFYSVLSERVEQERRAAVMEFVTRANDGLNIGNFEIDLDTGEVRFRTSIELDGETLTEGLWRNIVQQNLSMMDLHADGLLSVMGGELTALEAIEQIDEDEDVEGEDE